MQGEPPEPIVVGVAQYEAARSRGESLERLRLLLGRYWRNADVIVLPEYSDVSPLQSRERLAAAAVPLEENSFLTGLAELAEELGSHFIAGVLEEEAGCRYSSVALVTVTGRVELLYRKRVLFDALGYRESETLCPGRLPLRVARLSGWRIGVAVCYELRFPEIARALAHCGADIIAYPAAWYAGPGKEEQLTLMARARAAENTVYTVVADQYGERLAGRSLVADPYGVKILDLGHGSGYAEAVLDPARLREARRALPLLIHAEAAEEAAEAGCRTGPSL